MEITIKFDNDALMVLDCLCKTLEKHADAVNNAANANHENKKATKKKVIKAEPTPAPKVEEPTPEPVIAEEPTPEPAKKVMTYEELQAEIKKIMVSKGLGKPENQAKKTAFLKGIKALLTELGIEKADQLKDGQREDFIAKVGKL